MKYKKGRTQGADSLGLRLCLEVAQQLRADPERASSESEFRFTVALDGVDPVTEQVCDVARVSGCTDGDDSLDLRDSPRRREHGGTTERVTDQDARRPIARAESLPRSRCPRRSN